MSENNTHENNEEFELLATPPQTVEISGELRAKASQSTSKVTLALVGVVLAVGGFVGGIAVGKSGNSSSSTSASSKSSTGSPFGGANPSRTRGGGFGTNRGGGVTGTITAVNGSTITIQDATGKSVTVNTTDQTQVTIGKTGAVSDLTTGSKVTVLGTPDSSGTITARTVLSGITGIGLGGGRGNQNPTPSATPTNG